MLSQEKIEIYKEKAVEYKHTRCNCSQAVLMALKDELNISEDMCMKLGSGFGTGMGGMQATCGALIGAVTAAGLMNESKTPTVMLSRQISSRFLESSKALACKDLKGLETGQVLCGCDDCIRHAIEALAAFE